MHWFSFLINPPITFQELTPQEATEYEHWESGDAESEWDRVEREEDEAYFAELNKEIEEMNTI